MLIACLLAAKSSVKADCYRDPHQNKLKCDNGATLFNLQQPAIISKMKIWKHHQIERQKATHKFISFIFSQSLSRMNPRYTERGKSDNAATLSLNLLHTHPSYMHRTMCILLRLHKCNFYPNLYYQSCASPEISELCWRLPWC